MSLVRNYFRELSESFGAGWNRFWFNPANPLAASVLRLLTGLVALYTVATYGPDLLRFFGADGLLPVDKVAQFRGAVQIRPGEWEGGGVGFSIFYWTTAPTDIWAVHYASLAVLAAWTLGLFSRVTNVVAVVVLLSYFHRAPMLTDALEPVLTMVTVYLCFAPTGAYLSVDSLLRRRREAEARPVLSVGANLATRLIQVHLTLIYTMMALGKLSGESWWTGMSAWWLAARTETAPFDLLWMHDYPLLGQFITHLILLYELTFIIFIWNRWTRPLLLILAPIPVGLLALFTGKFTFAVMLLVANLAFVSPVVFAALFGRLGRRQEQASVAAPAETPRRSERTPASV